MKVRWVSRCLGALVLATVFFSSCASTKYSAYTPQPVPAIPARHSDSIRVALVLGSGGAKGIAHLGVLSVLEEEGIPIDLIVGTSSGSVMGALYADYKNVNDILPKVRFQNKKSLLDIDMFNFRYGLYKGGAFQGFLKDSLRAETFEELQIPCIAVATDLLTGKEVAFGAGDLVPILHASCALPYFFQPVEIYGSAYVDGGVVNPVPVSVAKQQNPELIIAVDITQELPKELPSNLIGVARRSMEICFQKINGMCTEDADIIISPDVKHIDTFEDQAFDHIFQAGRAAAKKELHQIKKKLSALHRFHMKDITD